MSKKNKKPIFCFVRINKTLKYSYINIIKREELITYLPPKLLDRFKENFNYIFRAKPGRTANRI